MAVFLARAERITCISESMNCPGRGYLVLKIGTKRISKLQFDSHILAMTSADVRDMLDLPTGDGHSRPAKKQKVVEKRPGSDFDPSVP